MKTYAIRLRRGVDLLESSQKGGLRCPKSVLIT